MAGWVMQAFRGSTLPVRSAPALFVGVFLVILLLASSTAAPTVGSPGAVGQPPNLTPSLHPAAGTAPPLNVSARIVNWTAIGPKASCGGGQDTFFAHFAGNATGGTPPYRYLWDFGNGAGTTTVQDPSHVFQGTTPPRQQLNATLTVTDALGDSMSSTARAWVPVLTCPPVVFGPPTVYSSSTFFGLPAAEGYAVLGGIIAAFVIVAIMAALWKPERRPPPTRPAPPNTP